MPKFLAIDVETANCNVGSICQIGLASFVDNELISTISILVNPQTDIFTNGWIHHIDPDDVADAPTFDEVYPVLMRMINDNDYVLHYTPFEVGSFRRACQRYHLDEFDYDKWIDVAKMVRYVYVDVRQKGYGLKNISNVLGIDFEHHNAEEDARACGLVAYKCMEKGAFDFDTWDKNISFRYYTSGHPDTSVPNQDGVYFGMNIVFTGTLSVPRYQAECYAKAVGLTPTESVSAKTKFVVVGVQNPILIKDAEKSSKHLKAEKLINEGKDITILSEDDFFALVQ